MHQPVMSAAQLNQVIKAGLAAVGPMLDVVSVNKPSVGAAGETTAFVSPEQCALDSGRDGAGLSADGQGFAMVVVGSLGVPAGTSGAWGLG